MAAAVAEGEDRVAWANRMRLLMSPKGSVNADGSIKQARLGCFGANAQALTSACLRLTSGVLQAEAGCVRG
jgi:hypothetical protein